MRLVSGLVLAIASAGSVAASGQPPAKPPNIVFVLADDMGYGDPAFGRADARIPTPHIDRLARDGMRFTDAHAPGAVCVPSRYGLLTGRYPCRRRRMQPASEAVIEAGTVTLPGLLRTNGYATAMVGKWHLGFDGGPDLDYEHLLGGPCDRGFERFFGIPASLDIPPYYYVRDRRAVAAPTGRIAASATDGWSPIQGAFWREGGIAPGFVHEQVLPRVVDEAVGIVERHATTRDGRPLFLYVALPAPHTPWLPRPEYRDASGAGRYGDFVAHVDAEIGRLLAALDAAGMAADTLVMLSSDNGPVWYPGDVDRFGHRAAGPWRGMKGDAFEGGHRVPFVARWPGRVVAGAVSDRTICFTDVLATCAEAAGIDVPAGAGEDSVSFCAQLLGGEPASRREVTVLKQDASVVREGRWKLIRHRGSGGFTRGADTGPAPGQLYDLAADPGETDNVYATHPDIVVRLGRVAARANPANVVVVLADDMGYGDSSVYGGWIETPGLARMAREGMVFTDFHSSGVVCSPTRAGLVTGRYQERAGIVDVIDADPARVSHRWGLADEEVTFAELLRDAGHATGLFGKWHLGYQPRHNPLRHGFDEFRGFVSGNIDYHSHLDRMGAPDWWDGARRVARDGYLTEVITADAVDFIARHRDEPFCLLVSHGAVHAPIQAPDSAAVRGPSGSARPNGDRSRDETVRLMTQALDDSVAAILDAVRRNGIAGRTLVVFCSDNGGAAHMRCDPLRGGKGQVWEGGHRVPAIAWWPGTIRAGATTDALCSTLDLMPTMLELAGLAAPEARPLDGRSLAPLLRGEAAPADRQLFWLGRAMSDGHWKLVVQDDRPALFDLSADLGETNDVAARHPDRVAAMVAALAEWRRDVQLGATQQPAGR
ncbi:MAG: sulfatase-like hydrolase/transferase [Planctomycetes bacterium]|nr:sulfatase-like hydrolase/transferase [Planctomycetota bacterium]